MSQSSEHVKVARVAEKMNAIRQGLANELGIPCRFEQIRLSNPYGGGVASFMAGDTDETEHCLILYDIRLDVPNAVKLLARDYRILNAD